MRNEYPRPQFQREQWLNLNGPWQFAFDNERAGVKAHWETVGHELPLEINVPFCPESKLSGIEDKSRHEHVWYKKRFVLPDGWQDRVIVHFGAVDYEAKVYVNGQMVGSHVGGHVSFSFDITDHLTADWQSGAEQELALFVSDPTHDEAIPRGKQIWTEESQGIWYTRTTGIWQTVWLESVSEIHLEYVKMTPDIDRGMIGLDIELAGYSMADVEKDVEVEIEISFANEKIARERIAVVQSVPLTREIHVFGRSSFAQLPHGAARCWSPETPNLYDLKLRVYLDGELIDQVDSYFGMRKIHTESGRVYLNNRPYYQKLVLDQGYWPEGLMTAPSDEALKYDIEIMKEMGLNGARKHQKVEDPRYMYWADKLGFLLWGEMAAASVYTDKAVMRLQQEWAEVIRRDYNHPCIVTWTPFNESWGVPNIENNKAQQAHTESLYYLLKSIDQTRPVVGNDGWVMTKTDIVGLHHYNHGNPELEAEQDKVQHFRDMLMDRELVLSNGALWIKAFADGYEYEGQPIILTEMGGVAFANDSAGTWGYTQAKDEAAFLAQLEHIFSSIYASPYVFGFCYTQLSDVEQETNGFLTYDRKPKVDPAKIRAILNRWHSNVVREEGNCCC